MNSIRTTNPKILSRCPTVYALQFCREFTAPDGTKYSGIDPDDFTAYDDILKKYTSIELVPTKYYNATGDGWRWTGFKVLGHDILVITGYYGNVPSNSKKFTDLFVDFAK